VEDGTTLARLIRGQEACAGSAVRQGHAADDRGRQTCHDAGGIQATILQQWIRPYKEDAGLVAPADGQLISPRPHDVEDLVRGFIVEGEVNLRLERDGLFGQAGQVDRVARMSRVNYRSQRAEPAIACARNLPQLIKDRYDIHFVGVDVGALKAVA